MNRSKSFSVIILAAGKGKRMKSELPKVLFDLNGEPLIAHTLKAAVGLNPAKIITVISRNGTCVKRAAESAFTRAGFPAERTAFAVQERQLGTGDAVLCALPHLTASVDHPVLILNGDVPLINTETLSGLLRVFSDSGATVSFLTAELKCPGEYGRVVRSGTAVTAIIEAKDCTPEQLEIKEINCGIYLISLSFLKAFLNRLSNSNAQGEYYLTDLIEKAVEEDKAVSALAVEDSNEILGVNTRSDLWKIKGVLNMKTASDLCEAGIEIDDPRSLYVDVSCTVEPGVKIGPNVQIRGRSRVESGTVIEGSAFIVDSQIGKDCLIKFGVRIEGSKIGPACSIGPFANLRPGNVLEEGVRIGNFVELKKSSFFKGSKASHLSYIGDCEVGAEANIGAGTITCNYDGYGKYKTKIGPGAFIGSNTALVAPVEIGDGATIGAGSTITKDVENDALSLTRAPQQTISGWSKKKREKAK